MSRDGSRDPRSAQVGIGQPRRDQRLEVRYRVADRRALRSAHLHAKDVQIGPGEDSEKTSDRIPPGGVATVAAG